MAEPRLYRPAWFLRLFLRLEDFGAANDATTQTSTAPFDTKSKAIDAEIARYNRLIAQETANPIKENAALGITGQMAKAQAGISRRQCAIYRSKIKQLQEQKAKGGTGAGLDKPGEGDEWSVQFVTVPTEMEIEDKGFRTAAELTATFPFADMPIDPRIIREIRVEAFIGTVKSEDFGTPDNWHLKAAPSKTCIRRFNGYVDTPEMSHSDADATIHIKARSYESVLIDGKINPHAPAYKIAGTAEHLTAYINRILEQYPPTSGKDGGDQFKAVWFAADPTKEPTLGKKDLLRSLQTAQSRNKGNGAVPGQDPGVISEAENTPDDPNGTGDSATGGQATNPPKSITPDGMSIWDLITQACELCGCIPVYQPALSSASFNDDGTQSPLTGSTNGGKEIITFGQNKNDIGNYLLLTPPEAFLDEITDSHIRIAGGARDKFKRNFNDEQNKGWTSDVRFMVWGHNIKAMKLSRKMGKVRPTGVEVRAYNPDAHANLRMMKARFPPTNADIKAAALANPKGKGANKASKQTAKGGGKVEVIRTFVLQGVKNIQQLEDAAVSLYHQLTRAELSIELETDELSSYMDPDASLQSQSLVKCENDDPDLMRLSAGTPVRVTVAKQTGDNLIISTLSDFYGRKGNNVRDLILKQRDRWGNWLNVDGKSNSDAMDRMIQRIQRAYESAKLPDIFYVRSVKLKFSADESTGFSATMELANYMKDRDPAGMSAETKAMNDRRKKKLTKAQATALAAKRINKFLESLGK